MKRIIVTIIAVALAAGTSFAQASVGAGYLNSSTTTKAGDRSTKADPINGFYAGVGYTLPVGPVNFTPGFYFSALTKSNTAAVGSWISGKGTLTEMYMNIPLDFSFGVDLSGDLKVFVFAGPTVNVGLTSNYKVSGDIAGLFSADKTIDLYKDGNYGRFDVLVGGGVGLDIMSMIRVTAGYNYGLLDRDKASDSVALHRKEINLGVAYLF